MKLWRGIQGGQVKEGKSGDPFWIMLCSDAIQIEMYTWLSPGKKSGQHVNGNIYPFLKGLPVPGFCKVDACPQHMPAPGNHWQLWLGVSIYGWGCCQGIT